MGQLGLKVIRNTKHGFPWKLNWPCAPPGAKIAIENEKAPGAVKPQRALSESRLSAWLYDLEYSTMGVSGQQDKPLYKQEGSLAMYIWYMTENFPTTFHVARKGKLFTDDLPADAYSGESTECTIDPSDSWSWLLNDAEAGKQKAVQLLYKYITDPNEEITCALCEGIEALILDATPSYRTELHERKLGDFVPFAAGYAFVHLNECIKGHKDIRFRPAYDLDLICFAVALGINAAHWYFTHGDQSLTIDGNTVPFGEIDLKRAIFCDRSEGNSFQHTSQEEQYSLILKTLSFRGEDLRIALSNITGKDLSLDACEDAVNRGKSKLQPYKVGLREKHLM